MEQNTDICFFSPCNSSDKLQTFKSVAIQTISDRSREIQDELYRKLNGKESISAHKSCYCSYTSKIKQVKSRKRKSVPDDEPLNRMLKSECSKEYVFKRDCLLCGDECKPKDSKNPHRWVPVRQCSTVDRDCGITFKEQLINICKARDDQWSQEVMVRLSGVIDLPAADAQYHKPCYDRFRIIPMKTLCSVPSEEALQKVISMMNMNANDTWTTSELYSMYLAEAGELSKRQFISNISNCFGEKILFLDIVGCDSVVGFKANLGQLIKIVKVDSKTNDDLDKLVKKIQGEILAKPRPTDYNLSEFSRDKVIENTSETLLKLVSDLVSDGSITKQSLTLAQCIQQHLGGWNQTTLGLAVKLHHKYGSSELIRLLNELGITANYDEMMRFRKSVAKFVAVNQFDYHRKLGLSTEIGPIFSWADNYDLYISSPNGVKSTHAMVMQFTQHPAGIINPGTVGVMQLKIPRLRKAEAASLQLTNDSAVLEHYNGPSKLSPPVLQTNVLSDDESHLLSSSLEFCQRRDAEWLSQVHCSTKPFEWAPYNAQQDRLIPNTEKKPKTVFVLGPMIDAPPAHPDTVLTTLITLERSLLSFGMQYIHLTVDLQLYEIACLIQWNGQERWRHLILHPGMMHTLMSFIGCIGTLMKATGMEVILGAAFGGIPNILNGKAWTKALRAYRLIVAVVLKSFFANGAKTYQELNQYLQSVRESPTGKLWVDCLVKPVLLALMFLHAERNGDFILQQYCLKGMLPYFFAAGHHNYARYMSWYVRQMENLPRGALKDLHDGAHVCRHSDGGTAVPADQFGEQTYIKRGKGSGGMKGFTTSAEQVAVWVNSFSVCAHIDIAMDTIHTEDNDTSDGDEIKKHKEEGEKRRKLDENDREKISAELDKYVHPFDDQNQGLFNICNGQVAAETVNVHDALAIGSEQSEQFSHSLSQNFNKPIKRKVKTMEVLKKPINVKGKAIYDMETLFGRLFVVGQQRKVEPLHLFQFECSPVPPSLIDEYGYLRKGDKSVIVKSLGRLAANPNIPDVLLVDAGQLLYHVVWPLAGTAGDLANNLGARLVRYPAETKKRVLFDGYDQETPSAKEHERVRRGRSKEIHLTPNTPLPCREAVMHNSKNKQLLNTILCGYDLGQNIELVNRLDSIVTHDEADITIISYMLKAVEEGAQTIRALCDDADVFAKLVYWTSKKGITANIQMEKWNHDILDINRTVDELGPRKCRQLLGNYTISGCDTVSFPYGKGKLSALKLLEIDLPGLDDVLGEPEATAEQLKATADAFFLPLYGQASCSSMNEARARTYLSRKIPPPLKKLPPTDENLQLHVLRAHLQMMLWKAADKRDPPLETRDITKYGWCTDGLNITPAVSTAPLAPQQLLDVVSCGCVAEGRACINLRCSCNNAGLSCTHYCKCEGGAGCCNHFTRREINIVENNDDDDSGDDADDDGDDDV